MSAVSTADFGVYVHVPFCARRCDYCAFATWTDRGHLMASYMAAVGDEVDQVVRSGSIPPSTSVFFGGGTPSLVPGELLVDVLDRIPASSGVEVTVECNPDTVTPGLLATYRSAGVTRISLGVQSMTKPVLASLGRTHDPDNVARAVDAIRAADFDSFNLDLIYGVHGESLADWSDTLRLVLDLGPPHVSAYALTIEAGTPLALAPNRHPDPDGQADMYLMATEVLGGAGLECYEISNFSLAGHECRHNLLYWSQGEYRGFGCAAHSHQQGRRWWNLRTPERYMSAVGQGRPSEAAGEQLGDAERTLEGLQLALRTRAGVPTRALVDSDELIETGLIRVVGHQAVLTPTGRLLANEVALRLR